MDTIYTMDIGNLYRTLVYDKMALTVSMNKNSTECGFLHEDEWFVLLEKNVSVRSTRILTANGEVGWVQWSNGTRFEEPDQEQ